MATTKSSGKKGGAARGPGHRYTAEYRREALRMLDAGKSLSEELAVSMGTLSQ